MSVSSGTYSQRQAPNVFPALLIVALLAVIFGFVLSQLRSPEITSTASIHIHPTIAHAVETHGLAATQHALDVCRKNGTINAVSEFETGNIHWLCQDDDGNIIDMITKILTRTMREPGGETDIITIYKPIPHMKASEYIAHLISTKGAKLVPLFIRAGAEVFGP